MSSSHAPAATHHMAPRAIVCLAVLFISLVGALGTAATARASSAPTFARTDYAACLRTSWVEPVDVTGDGLLDLVACGEGDDTVVVLEGDGRGGFAFLSSVLSGGDGPYSLDVAEYTGDDIPDVAVVNRWSKTVTILQGDGAGGFSFLRQTSVGGEAIDVKATDLDEDGDLDLVSCNMWTTSLNLLLNDGEGAFTRKDVALPFKGATVMGIGDPNGDGHVDVAVGHYWATTATILFGDGNGNLNVGRSLEVGKYPTGALFADFDDDGRQDIVVASRYPNNASVYVGDGSGGFDAPTRYGIGPFAKVPVAADFNLDGALDCAICNWGADGASETTVSLLSGRGDGTFDPELRLQVGNKPHSVAVADLNNDGRPDLVTPNSATNNVTVLLNTTPMSQLDVTPPVTTTSADAAWHHGQTTVTFSATDTQSGVAYTQFGIDGGGWRTGTAVTIGTEGVHTVVYRSVDNAGNVEATHAAEVKIDNTAPALAVISPVGGAAYAQYSNVIADWIVSDTGGSGLSAAVATVDGTAIAKSARVDTLAAGAHTLVVTVTDAAGNVATATVGFVITAAPAPEGITLGWPLGGETVLQGSTNTVRWTLSTPFSDGTFKIWLKKADGNYTLVAGPIAAVPGQSSYSRTWGVTQAPVANGSLRVRYYTAAGVSSYKAENPITVLSTLPTLTWPTGGETVVQSSTHVVSWTIPNAVSEGRYRLWLKNAAGTYVQITPAPIFAVPGQKTYTWSWAVTQPPVSSGILRLRYYSESGGTVFTIEKTITIVAR